MYSLCRNVRKRYNVSVYDVVPPTGNSREFKTNRKSTWPRSDFAKSSSGRKRIVRGKSRRMPEASSTPKKPVVEFDWKLPARLRRPVRYELERQRRKNRQKKAIIQFERRPLYSELPSKYPIYSSKRSAQKNRGAEYNTGDMWQSQKPGASVVMPPYAGGIMKRPAVQSRPIKQLPQKSKRVVEKSKQPSQKKPVPIEIRGERDVPYDWAGKEPQVASVEQPKRRFALPLHFSIFPKNIVPARAGKEVESKEDIKEAWRKKKLRES
jgi:hypothetical protein